MRKLVGSLIPMRRATCLVSEAGSLGTARTSAQESGTRHLSR